MLIKSAGEISVWEHLQQQSWSGATCQGMHSQHPPSLPARLLVSHYPITPLWSVTFTVFTHLLRMSPCFNLPWLQLCLKIRMCEHMYTCAWDGRTFPWLDSQFLQFLHHCPVLSPLWHHWTLSWITSYMTAAPSLSSFYSLPFSFSFSFPFFFTVTTPPFSPTHPPSWQLIPSVGGA